LKAHSKALHICHSKNLISFCLVFLFFCVIILSTIVFKSILQKNLLERISRGYYGQSKITFTVNGSSSFVSINKLVTYLPKSASCALYNDNNDGTVRQIYYQGKYNTPPIISGRFFSKDDFEGKTACAVAGKNRLNKSIFKNGIRYIDYQCVKFKVIGVVGTTTSTQLDDMIFINSNYSSNSDSRLYVLDVDGTNAPAIFQKFAAAAAKDSLNAKIISTESSGLSRIIPKLLNSQILLILAIISFTLSILIITLEWVHSQYMHIAVKRMLGWKSSQLIKEMLCSYLLYVLLAVLCGFIFLIFLGEFNVFAVIDAFISTLICSMVVIIPSILKMLRIPVSEALR